MTKSYDKHYQEPNYFGDPYPELIEFFKLQQSGKLLDLGCGQGRNALPLARLGFKVTGIDSSKVGIAQMLDHGKNENLDIIGKVDDIYKYKNFKEFDYILLDSMFHFLKRDRVKETNLVKRIIDRSKTGTTTVFCIRDSGNKVKILNESIDHNGSKPERLLDRSIKYSFAHEGQTSDIDYKIIAVKK